MALGRLQDWEKWVTTTTHKVQRQHNKMYKLKVTTKQPGPQKKRKPVTASRKRRRQANNSATGEHHPIDLFSTPTATQYSTAAVALARMPNAYVIQSLREGKHISSAAIDEALILLLRPRMPTDTALLLCTDSLTS